MRDTNLRIVDSFALDECLSSRHMDGTDRHINRIDKQHNADNIPDSHFPGNSTFVQRGTRRDHIPAPAPSSSEPPLEHINIMRSRPPLLSSIAAPHRFPVSLLPEQVAPTDAPT